MLRTKQGISATSADIKGYKCSKLICWETVVTSNIAPQVHAHPPTIITPSTSHPQLSVS
ncbi:hypothetical protein J6590_006533 [Homalodisca vitripennis]|nr:hypothetical protein J6590_006533 [Homalodisca vitripennis]